MIGRFVDGLAASVVIVDYVLLCCISIIILTMEQDH